MTVMMTVFYWYTTDYKQYIEKKIGQAGKFNYYCYTVKSCLNCGSNKGIHLLIEWNNETTTKVMVYKLCVVFLSVSVATCTAYRMYLIRTCADLSLFLFFLKWSVDLIQLSCSLLYSFFCFIFPEVYTCRMFCGHELMWESNNNNNK